MNILLNKLRKQLYFAIIKENLEIIQMLLNQPGIDIDFQSLCYIDEQFGNSLFSSTDYKSAYQLALEIKNDKITNFVSSKTNKNVSNQPVSLIPINLEYPVISIQSQDWDDSDFINYLLPSLIN